MALTYTCLGCQADLAAPLSEERAWLRCPECGRPGQVPEAHVFEPLTLEEEVGGIPKKVAEIPRRRRSHGMGFRLKLQGLVLLGMLLTAGLVFQNTIALQLGVGLLVVAAIGFLIQLFRNMDNRID